MKRLIRNKATRAYLTPNGDWTEEVSGAVEFRSASEHLCIEVPADEAKRFFLHAKADEPQQV